MNEAELRRSLDMAKSKAFTCNSHAALLAPTMASLDFKWDNSIESIGTDGISVHWNKDHFISLDQTARETALMHEVYHVALLHNIRGENLDPRLWNMACDYKINNSMIAEGYSFSGLGDYLYDPSKFNLDMSEEEIYEILKQESDNGQEPEQSPGFSGMGAGMQGEGEDSDLDGEPNGQSKKNPGNDKGDLLVGSKEDMKEVIHNVMQAMQQAKMAGQEAGGVFGGVQLMIDQFLKPQVSWNKILMEFFADHVPKPRNNWNKRNRRFEDIHLPSSRGRDRALSHLIYYIDVSGSVTDEQVQKFSSEVNFVHATFKPKKITIYPFDTSLREPIVIESDDEFPALNFEGRGGTCLECVHENIEEMKPTAAIVFSDLYCYPMEVPTETPVVWIVMDNPGAVVKKGTMVHIK